MYPKVLFETLAFVFVSLVDLGLGEGKNFSWSDEGRVEGNTEHLLF